MCLITTVHLGISCVPLTEWLSASRLTTEPTTDYRLLLGAVLYNFHNYNICNFIVVDCRQVSTVHLEEKYCLQSLSRDEGGKWLLTGTAFLTMNSLPDFKGIKPSSKYLENQCLNQYT